MAYAFKQSKLNVFHMPNPALITVFTQGMAMFFIQDLAAPAVAVLAAKSGNDTTSSWTAGITSPEHPKAVRVVFAASYDGGNITLVGTDQLGRAQTEVVTANPNNTVEGVNIWKTITSIAKGTIGANAATFTVQTGLKVGLPVPLLQAWGMELHDGIAELATAWDATYYSFTPATTPNGSVDYTVLVPVDWAKYDKLVIAEAPNV
jgi:hypothetical protein